MATDQHDTESKTAMDRVMTDIRRELVRRVAKRNRDQHRDIYDALDDE